MYNHLSIYMTKETKQQLDALSHHYNTSMAGVIRELVFTRHKAISKRKVPQDRESDFCEAKEKENESSA